jgi:hypothetical protein
MMNDEMAALIEIVDALADKLTRDQPSDQTLTVIAAAAAAKEGKQMRKPRARKKTAKRSNVLLFPHKQPANQERPEWPICVRLLFSSISNDNGESVLALFFRQPKAYDIRRCGNPVFIDFDGNCIIDEKKMTAMIAALSGILPAFIETMDPRDWNSCAYRLRNFFLPDLRSW